MKIIFILFIFVGVALAIPPRPPQAPTKNQEWLSPMPYPKGMVKFNPTKITQSISVLDGQNVIKKVNIIELETKWHVSGGMINIKGWKSDKYKLIPTKTKYWLDYIQVKNSLGSYQPNLAIKRDYPEGTRFDDVLSKDGEVFEHRVREKVNGKWDSKIIYKVLAARPKGYDGLKISCSSCHEESGSGDYGVGLVPGGDTVLSDPLDWSVIERGR